MANGDGVRHVGLQAVSLPSHFSDGNLTQWLERFTTCATANEWTAAQQLVRLPKFLECRAYTLYRRLLPGERDTIEHRENLLALFYPEEARETHRLELYNYKCTSDEDIDQFVYRLEQKFDQAHPELPKINDTLTTTTISETFGSEHDKTTEICNVIIVVVSDTLNETVQAQNARKWTIVVESAIDVTVVTTGILDGPTLRIVTTTGAVTLTVAQAIEIVNPHAGNDQIQGIVSIIEGTDRVHAIIGTTLRIRILATSISSIQRTLLLSFWSFTSTGKSTDTRSGASWTQAAQPQA